MLPRVHYEDWGRGESRGDKTTTRDPTSTMETPTYELQGGNTRHKSEPHSHFCSPCLKQQDCIFRQWLVMTDLTGQGKHWHYSYGTPKCLHHLKNETPQTKEFMKYIKNLSLRHVICILIHIHATSSSAVGSSYLHTGSLPHLYF